MLNEIITVYAIIDDLLKAIALAERHEVLALPPTAVRPPRRLPHRDERCGNYYNGNNCGNVF
jgi:hypothetical protein